MLLSLVIAIAFAFIISMSGGENQPLEKKVSAIEKRLREMELKLESKPSPCSKYYIDSAFSVFLR